MKSALYILIIFISLSFIYAQSNVFIKNVPDYSQPPDSTIPSSIDTTNYCAPMAFLNIVQYWDSVQYHPYARGLMFGLSGKETAHYIGWFMDTNDQGSPDRENGNTRPVVKGTYINDQKTGMEDYISFSTSNPLLFPYPIPTQKKQYDWYVEMVPVPDFLMFKEKIDLGIPVKIDFMYWNVYPTGNYIFDTELAEDTIFVYDWGDMVSESYMVDERAPNEQWNLMEGEENIGHAVTAVGYLENYSMDTSYVIVHDNWEYTPKNIAIPWIDTKISAWFFYHLPEPPDLAVTNIQTAIDTSVGFTDSLWVNQPITVATTIHNLGTGPAVHLECTTEAKAPDGSQLVIKNEHRIQTLNPPGAGLDSIVVYFDSLFIPTIPGTYDITSWVYWDLNGDSLVNELGDLDAGNDTMTISAQVSAIPLNIAFIDDVPDHSQPPASTLPSSMDISNYCAPYAYMNIVEYWDSVKTQPFARGLMAGLPANQLAEYIGWFMDTNDQGSPARHNGITQPPAKGTYVMDQWEGAIDFTLFHSSDTLLFPYPVPTLKERYSWDIQYVPVADFPMFKEEIDQGNPVKLDFKYWNILPTGTYIVDPEVTEDTIFVYKWGTMVASSGSEDERDPVENWNLAEGEAGIGHAVTAVGYVENYYADTSLVIVHDNWANTPENIAIPWTSSKIVGWFFYHLSEPPDLTVTNIQTAIDTYAGFTDTLLVDRPVTIALTIDNLGSGGAGYCIANTTVRDPGGSTIITKSNHSQIALDPQQSIVIYFNDLFTPVSAGTYTITSNVYWDLNGDGIENDSRDANEFNDTLSVFVEIYAVDDIKQIKVPYYFATIQEAIDAASDGHVILVDEGTYYENINFKGKAITVASRFFLDSDTSHISKTIIDGSQPTDPAKASVVTFETNEDTTSVLMGFTITGGKGTAVHLPGWNPERDGGGIYLKQSGGKITDNHIINNTITTNGDTMANAAGIAIWCETANKALVRNNLIKSNKIISSRWAVGAGAIIFSKGYVLFEKNDVISNRAEGYNNGIAGGLAIDGVGGYLSKSIVRNNLIKDNTTFASLSQRTYGGGVWIRNVSPIVSNNIIVGNKAEYGGGIGVEKWPSYSGNAEPVIMNNTVTDNIADYGGAMEVWGIGTYPTIINTIFWGNTARQDNKEIALFSNGNGIVVYSNVKGGWEGEGNIDKNPAFEDSLFRLSDSSWCVGNGVDSVRISGITYYSPPNDYNGNPRPHSIDDYVDMGAIESPYERYVDPSAISEDDSKLPTKFALHQNYPNPFNPKTVIRYALPITCHLELSIYNILGQKVATLVSKKQPAGRYEVEWDATGFTSGVYFYRLSTNKGYVETKKLLLLK